MSVSGVLLEARIQVLVLASIYSEHDVPAFGEIESQSEQNKLMSCAFLCAIYSPLKSLLPQNENTEQVCLTVGLLKGILSACADSPVRVRCTKFAYVHVSCIVIHVRT